MAIQSATNTINSVSVPSYSPPSRTTASESTSVELKAIAVNAVEKEPTATELKSAVDNINQALQKVSSNLTFSIDQDTSLVVVKLIDKQAGDVIRQFPSKETIAIAKAIDAFQKGLFLDKQA